MPCQLALRSRYRGRHLRFRERKAASALANAVAPFGVDGVAVCRHIVGAGRLVERGSATQVLHEGAAAEGGERDGRVGAGVGASGSGRRVSSISTGIG